MDLPLEHLKLAYEGLKLEWGIISRSQEDILNGLQDLISNLEGEIERRDDRGFQ